MQILRVNPAEDREAFLDERRGTIGGSDIKSIQPLTRGTDRRPSGLWKLIAGKLFIAADGEKSRDRGLRVEEAGMQYVARKFDLKMDYVPGMWIADWDKDAHSSPDGAELADLPTWAAENKALDSHTHIMAIAKDLEARKLPGYNPFDSTYISPKNDYRYQVRQYFVINDACEKVYFNLHDDRAVEEELENYTIVITREDVGQDSIDAQKYMQLNTLEQARDLTKFILKELTETENA